MHFYIILCRNIWAGLQTLWLFCFSFPYNIQIHIPGGANFQFRKFLCGTLNGILKPSQTRERYFRRPINFYRPITIPTGRNKKIKYTNTLIQINKYTNTEKWERRYFRRPINFYGGPIPSPPGGSQSFYNSVKADAGDTKHKIKFYVIWLAHLEIRLGHLRYGPLLQYLQQQKLVGWDLMK